MKSFICSTVAEQPGHTDRIGIVVLQPLLPAKAVSHGRLEPGGKFQHLSPRKPAAIAAENSDFLGGIDHFR